MNKANRIAAFGLAIFAVVQIVFALSSGKTGKGGNAPAQPAPLSEPVPLSKLAMTVKPWQYDYSPWHQRSDTGKYSTILDDILRPVDPITVPCGGIEAIELGIDMSGFGPLSLVSKKRDSSGSFFTDIFRWYAFPTPEFIAMLYYGDASKKTAVKVCAAAAAPPGFCELAYSICAGKDQLFTALSGSTGADSCAPVCWILTATKAQLIVNFEYSSIDRSGTGQLLAVLEFTRDVKYFRSASLLYHNMPFSPSAQRMFAKAAPYVAQYLQGGLP